MASVISILTIIGPLLEQLSGIISKAIAASTANNQADLDALHAQAIAMADALASTV